MSPQSEHEVQAPDSVAPGNTADPDAVDGLEEGAAEALADDAPAVALARARRQAIDQGETRRDAGIVKRAQEKARARKRRNCGASEEEAGGRDPVGLGSLLNSVMRRRGWSDPVAVGSVLARWPEIVGEQVASHAVPESFEDTVVVVRCSSTAWATNLELMQHDLLKRLDAAVGHGVVTRIKVLGPSAPTWRRGPRVAPGGRGPRDTYG